MGRAPCCEKMGLNKGPWSHNEDQILISYIQKHGHPNWRALPKHAGLLRCGKSCRLRWTNYLRPDIKRGNFSKEEEETIIHLHEKLGNRWSVIAAKLPGRTDNEIKNVWHTHLKKRLESHQTEVSKEHHTKSKCASKAPHSEEESIFPECLAQREVIISVDKERSTSNQPSSSESSSVTEATGSPNVAKLEEIEHDTFLDESFWSETLSGEGDGHIVESNTITNVSFAEFSDTPSTLNGNDDNKSSYTSYDISGMDLWYDVFTRMEELPELPEF